MIQDVDIPIDRAAEFLEFLLREIGIVPVWLCPLRAPRRAGALHALSGDAGQLYVNFGFWDKRAQPRRARAAGTSIGLVEREVMRLGGIKSLYSDSFSRARNSTLPMACSAMPN